MSRLIDADELIKVIVKEYSNFRGLGAELAELIDLQPTFDQWHYPSKGEYPKKNVEVLCRLWFGGYIVAHLREDDEFTAGKVAFGIECWQYIVPPQEEA